MVRFRILKHPNMPYFDIASTYTMANGGDEFLEEGVTYRAFKVRVIRSPKIIKLL